MLEDHYIIENRRDDDNYNSSQGTGITAHYTSLMYRASMSRPKVEDRVSRKRCYW